MAYRFYSHHHDRQGWMFSNFADLEVEIDGRHYATSEHYYQAMKFALTDKDWAHAISEAKTPGEAKKMGNDHNHPMDPDWDEKKYSVMITVLRAKARQHKIMREELLRTKGMTIEEASPYDYVWGTGKDGTGKNLLGKALMQVRDEIMKKSF